MPMSEKLMDILNLNEIDFSTPIGVALITTFFQAFKRSSGPLKNCPPVLSSTLTVLVSLNILKKVTAQPKDDNDDDTSMISLFYHHDSLSAFDVGLREGTADSTVSNSPGIVVRREGTADSTVSNSPGIGVQMGHT